MPTYWSEIPTDLLYSILSKLSIPDLFHCAAVCSHWSAVVDKFRRCPGIDQRPQIPWLVPEKQFLINGKYNYQNTYNFFSLSEGREYDIPSHGPRILKKFVGSSYGWLIATNEVSVQLLNPITGVQIDLPSIPTLDDRNLETVKAVLSSDPSRGDEEWKMISGDVYYYDDITFHKGKLYAVSRSEEDDEVTVAAYDLMTLDSTPTGTPVVGLSDIFRDFDVVLYFFCASPDELLIARTMTNKSEHYINKLEVWKVNTEKSVVVTVNNLGKYALFLSAASSLCLDTSSSLLDLESNSIYISVDLFESNFSDNLVYSMEDESFTSLSLPSLSSRELQRPILVWFTPSRAC